MQDSTLDDGRPSQRIRLDYAGVADRAVLDNLSGVVADGERLWTVSDEGRSFHCLDRRGGGYALFREYALDEEIKGLPGQGGDELDLESIDIAEGALWLCGSHCNVRVQPKPKDAPRLKWQIRQRPSRRVLARLEIRDGRLGKAKLAPLDGPRSIRAALAEDRYLRPFINLPGKENGLDIEGVVVFDDEVLLGLRGPILDSMAVIVHLTLNRDLEVKSHRLSFLDLAGLGLRDLIRHDDAILLIAGPVGDAKGPFALHRWRPNQTTNIQKPVRLCGLPANGGKPEGLCLLERNGQPGVLLVYDRTRADESSSNCEADWFDLQSLFRGDATNA